MNDGHRSSRQPMTILSVNDNIVLARGEMVGPFGEAGLVVGRGVTIRVNLSGDRRLTSLQVDRHQADPGPLLALLGPNASQLFLDEAGSTVDVSLPTGLATVAALNAMRRIPHRSQDRRVWDLEMANEGARFAWLGSEFREWLDEVTYRALCFVEDWVERSTPSTRSGPAILAAARHLVEEIEPDSPYSYLADELAAQIGSFETEFVSLSRPLATMGGTVGRERHDVVYCRLPEGTFGPGDWFAGALEVELRSDSIQLRLDAATTSEPGQEVIFARIGHNDAQPVNWIGVLRRRPDGDFAGVVATPGRQRDLPVTVDLVDGLSQKLLSANDRLIAIARQWMQAGGASARAATTDYGPARAAYRRAVEVFNRCDTDLEELASAYLADPTKDALPFLADLDDEQQD